MVLHLKPGASEAHMYMCCVIFVCVHRCSLMGFDLNRHWANPSPWAHPTLHGVKQLIVEMYNNPVSGEGNARAATHLRYRLSPPVGIVQAASSSDMA